MCGIAGYFSYGGFRPDGADVLKQMTDTLRHRGPDGEGAYRADGIGLGHRRLAIIDLKSGQQPMYRQDRQLVLVFNGEIYNYVELRDELQRLGHRFATQSDSEVILAAYQQWGTDCVTRFNGMWAFALWDAPRRRLFCSRDRAGEKPFYYSMRDGSFVFASEPKALFAYGIPRQVDTAHLEAYLTFGYVPSPDSFFRGVSKLPPAHNIVVEQGKTTMWSYWDIDIRADPRFCERPDEAYERFAELFKDAVRIRMRCDVPFGAFLSGGLDSASVVSVMPAFSEQPVSTFTIGFCEQAFDERQLAALVAEKFKTRHTESVVSLDSGITSIDHLSHFYDEPFGDSSALPTYWVSHEARKHVTMVLTGDAGDEVLSGYPVHQSEKIAGYLKAVPALLRSACIGLPLGALNRHGGVRFKRMSSLYELTQLPLPQRILRKQNVLPMEWRGRLLDKGGSVINPAISYVDRVLQRKPELSTWDQLNYWLFKVSLPEDMLVKVDRASMACSLESRIPFLDHRIVELLAAMPPSIKMPRLVRKSVLRRTIATKLPGELLRAPKQGFTAPESALNLLGKADAPQIRERVLSLADSLPLKRDALGELLRDPQAISTNAWWALLMLTSVMGGARLES